MSNIAKFTEKFAGYAISSRNRHPDLRDRTATARSFSENKPDKGFADVTLPPNQVKMSNDFLRSALFSVKKRSLEDAGSFDREKIAMFGNATMYLTGKKLDQTDYKVYEALIQKFKGEDTLIKTSIPGILTMMNVQDNESYRHSLLVSLRRLNDCRIEITTPNYRYLGGLVNSIQIKEDNEVIVKLGNELAIMFSRQNWTRLDRNHRDYLGKNSMATWLYNFCMTHSNMFPISRSTIRKLCGNEDISQNKFNAKLKFAIALINNELGQFGWECRIDEDKLYVTKPILGKPGDVKGQTIFI